MKRRDKGPSISKGSAAMMKEKRDQHENLKQSKQQRERKKKGCIRYRCSKVNSQCLRIVNERHSWYSNEMCHHCAIWERIQGRGGQEGMWRFTIAKCEYSTIRCRVRSPFTMGLFLKELIEHVSKL
jgi:hypothetical protein